MARSTASASMHDEHFKILQAMVTHGGGFVSALAVAWQKADSANSAKLMAQFRGVYLEYYRTYVLKTQPTGDSPVSAETDR